MNRLRVALVAIGTITSIQAQIIGDPQPNQPATSTTVASVAVTASTSALPISTVDDSDAPVTLYQNLAGTSTPVAAPIATASPSVVSIFFPGADDLPYVGAVLGGDANAQILAISCGPGVNSDTCGFPSSVTVTAGPSTAYVSVANEEATFIYDCKITGSTAAVCAETFNGNVAYIATSSGTAAGSGSTSSVLTETLGPKDIKWMPITITGKGAGTPKPAPTPAPSSPAIPSAPTGKPDGGAQPPAASSSAAYNGAGWAGNGTVAPTTANMPIGIWTGGAGGRLVGLGNYVAGLLALAAFIL